MTTFMQNHNASRVRRGQTYEFAGEVFTVGESTRSGLYEMRGADNSLNFLDIHTTNGKFISKMLTYRANRTAKSYTRAA